MMHDFNDKNDENDKNEKTHESKKYDESLRIKSKRLEIPESQRSTTTIDKDDCLILHKFVQTYDDNCR